MHKIASTGNNIGYMLSVKISSEAQKLYDFLPQNCWMTENNLGKAVKIRGSKIRSLKEELEAARLIDIYFYPNGKRSNAKHEIIKKSNSLGSPICKHISRAYCIDEWGWLDRNSLIECYLKSDWNIIPFEPRGKRPISNFCGADWRIKSAKEKMDYFFDNPTLNVGLVICHFTVADIETKNNFWSDQENFLHTLS